MQAEGEALKSPQDGEGAEVRAGNSETRMEPRLREAAPYDPKWLKSSAEDQTVSECMISGNTFNILATSIFS